MKKLIYLLTIYSTVLFAQSETECPFAPRKYVHYDGIIESTNTFIPTDYTAIVQNNNAYERGLNYLNQSAQAKCFYKTSIHNHDSIKKPFVFVEGISFEKKLANAQEYTLDEYFRQDWYPTPPASVPQCLEAFNSAPQYHGYYVGNSTFNWATLVTGIDAEGYHDGDPLRVEKAPELLNQLCCAGFDICFIDFVSGQEYIESNGEALYDLLLKIHAELVANNSTEKMVVCGASMGGLVARYAINKLEAEGHTDWVEKFISFDSPQMGANIPLSVQYTLKHLKALGGDVEEKYNKLTCPSASQLVNYSCLETSFLGPITYTTPIPSLERQALVNNPYMGWPAHCIKYSISNGSRLGDTQSSQHQPGDKVLDIDGLIEMDLYALPQNDNNFKKVFDFDLPICLIYNIPLIGLTSQSVRVKNTMALDLAPGSFRRDLQEIASGLPNFTSNWFGQAAGFCNLDWIDNSVNSNQLCFIPIMSSIGAIDYEVLMKAHPITSSAILNIMFDGDSHFEDFNHQFSNFDIVYAPLHNQSHVEITDENIEWLMNIVGGFPALIKHENKFLHSNTYKASALILAGNNISNNSICGSTINNGVDFMNPQSPCGDVIVSSNAVVFYKAGEYIDLFSGFYTDDNATFQAEIVPIPHCYSNGRNSEEGNLEASFINATASTHKVTDKEKVNRLNVDQLISLFPNPSSTYVDIHCFENIEMISIHSMLGDLITKQQINQNSTRISTLDLAEGIYLVNIKPKFSS